MKLSTMNKHSSFKSFKNAIINMEQTVVLSHLKMKLSIMNKHNIVLSHLKMQLSTMNKHNSFKSFKNEIFNEVFTFEKCVYRFNCEEPNN